MRGDPILEVLAREDGDALPARPERRQRVGAFEHRGRSVAYSVVGGGPPLVVDFGRIHDLRAFWRNARYRHLVESLSRRHMVIRFDRPGCGLSDRSAADFRLGAELALFDRLLDHLGIARTAVLGVGSSALASVAAAARRPSRVSRLIVFGAFAVVPQAEEQRAIFASMFRQDPAGAVDLVAGAAAAGCDPEAVGWLTGAYASAASADVIRRCVDQSLQTDVTPLLGRIRCPTLVLHRSEEPVFDLGVGRAVAAAIPRSVLVPLDGTERLPWEGDPRPFVRSVVSFLASEGAPVVAGSVDALTAREREVVKLVAAGLTNRAIAARLGVGARTAESHVKSIRVKLGLRSRAHVAAWGARAELDI